jgi:putative DNA primase/helicase
LIRRLYEDKTSISCAKEFVADRRNRYIDRAKARAASSGLKPLERATARFATVYAAGCLAIEYKILPFERNDLLRAVLRCQLESLLTTVPSEPETAHDKLLRYVEQRAREFIDLDEQKLPRSHELGTGPGYRATYKGGKWLYLTAGQLTMVIGNGKEARELKSRLINDEVLASSANKPGLVQRPLIKGKGNKGFRWVHAFRAASFEGAGYQCLEEHQFSGGLPTDAAH